MQWLKLPVITGSNPTLAFKFQINKMFLPRLLVMIQYTYHDLLHKLPTLELGRERSIAILTYKILHDQA